LDTDRVADLEQAAGLCGIGQKNNPNECTAYQEVRLNQAISCIKAGFSTGYLDIMIFVIGQRVICSLDYTIVLLCPAYVLIDRTVLIHLELRSKSNMRESIRIVDQPRFSRRASLKIML
tara:strand:+ start:494 stop:850 length:357 start_codon:yes stop_codon:yes gene_type:complete